MAEVHLAAPTETRFVESFEADEKISHKRNFIKLHSLLRKARGRAADFIRAKIIERGYFHGQVELECEQNDEHERITVRAIVKDFGLPNVTTYAELEKAAKKTD